MSGHSKWATIKHKKGAADKARGKLWAKLIRQVEVAARAGGGDIEANPTLRTMVDKAKGASVPNDTIDRAIKRAAMAGQGEDYQEVRYEGYGPYGVAVIVEALTDNRNRTAGDLRSAFAKAGGALGETNSVAFQFERKGILWFPGLADKAEAMLEAAIEAGALDVESDEEGHEVTCAPEDFFAVRDSLEAVFGSPESAKVEWVPNVRIDLDEDKAREILKLLERLDESDDVQNVYANFEVSEAVSERLSA